MKVLVLLFLFFINQKIVFSQSQYPVKFCIKLKNSVAARSGDLNTILIFMNTGDSDILITRHFEYGYEKGIIPKKNGNLIWDMEVYKKNKFLKQPVTTIDSPIPFIVLENELYDTLKVGDSIKHKFPLYAYYQLGIGKYRVRAKYIVPLELAKSKKIIYSNWIVFSVVKRIDYIIED